MNDGMTRGQAETALRAREAELARVQRIGLVGGFEIDLRGGGLLNRRSPEYLRLHGLAHDAVAEQHEDWVQRLHPEDRDWAEGYFLATLAGPSVEYASEYRIMLPGSGVRWIAASGEIERDAAGRALRMVGVHIDITRTKHAEIALRRLNEELEARVEAEVRAREAAQAQLDHVQRMEALGQLAGGIAHDFNNILQVMQGGAALIGRKADDPAAVRRLAAMLGDASERGSSITRRLLAFARRGELRAEPVDVAELFGGLREILAHTLGGAIAVEVELIGEIPALLADKGQLETVLVNLATNARDAMPAGGVLRMTAAAVEIGEDDAAGLRPGAYVCFAAADTGEGMDAATLAHAAEPFFSTKPAGKGTGLGLAMARGFAGHSGGGLRIESTLGVGTEVRLWLPVVLPQGVPPRPPHPATAAAGPVRAAWVLLADDDAHVRTVLGQELEAAGYRVLLAADGQAALALLDQGATIDLIVSDLSMPGIDGVSLIGEMQGRRPGLPAILLTGFATETTALAASSAAHGVFSLLRKPVSGTELAERVAILLAAGPG